VLSGTITVSPRIVRQKTLQDTRRKTHHTESVVSIKLTWRRGKASREETPCIYLTYMNANAYMCVVTRLGTLKALISRCISKYLS